MTCKQILSHIRCKRSQPDALCAKGNFHLDWTLCRKNDPKPITSASLDCGEYSFTLFDALLALTALSALCCLISALFHLCFRKRFRRL